jgi:hypothetical protein
MRAALRARRRAPYIQQSMPRARDAIIMRDRRGQMRAYRACIDYLTSCGDACAADTPSRVRASAEREPERDSLRYRNWLFWKE